ncbi:Tetratricopeptide-like helical domain superfamily [Sesbania bispinosa]|nr:Tetratricopeptide-like helical domain superfamily [Sesbania bispinosa]
MGLDLNVSHDMLRHMINVVKPNKVLDDNDEALYVLQVIYGYKRKLHSKVKVEPLQTKIAKVKPAAQRVVEDKCISLLRSCRTRETLHQIQAQTVTHGLHHNDYVTPSFITTCARLCRMGHARKLFDTMPEPNTATWNAMFRGYSQLDSHRDVIVLFGKMNNAAAALPNCFTVPMVVKSCGKTNAVREGEQVHCFASKHGFKSNPFVGTALIDMYSTRGSIGDAYKVFGEMHEKNVVVWTAIINAYISCGDVVSGRRLFDLAPERDVVMWSTVVSGYIELGNMVSARELFNKMPNRDVMSWNAMLIGYADNGEVNFSDPLFLFFSPENLHSYSIWNLSSHCTGLSSSLPRAFGPPPPC